MKKVVLATILAAYILTSSCSLGKYIRWGTPSFDPERLESRLEQISSTPDSTIYAKSYSLE